MIYKSLFILSVCIILSFSQCTRSNIGIDKKEEIPSTYIIMFKMDSTSDFEQSANNILQRADIDLSHVQHYYFSIKGVAINLSKDQAQKMKRNPNVASMEADERIQVDIPKPTVKH